MAIVSTEIVIERPVNVVFDFVADTPKLVDVWPSLIAVKDWRRDENDLGEFGFVYQIAGFKYSGINRDREFEQRKKIVTVSEGGMEAVVTWEFDPNPMGTHVVFTGDYRVEIPLLGKIISGRIAALNVLEIDSLLKNMKKVLENQ